MSTFDPLLFGSILGPLAVPDAIPTLGKVPPNESRRSTLRALVASRSAFARLTVQNESMAQCFLAGLYLLHDCLDDAHDIVQRYDHTTAAYWHALVHRKEGDYPNALYWFNRTDEHPVFLTLAEEARDLALASQGGFNTRYLRTLETWDAARFVELVENTIDSGSASEALCRQIHLCEVQRLLEFTFRKAVGRS